MTTDRIWITERNRNSPAFLKGLHNFIEIAKNHVDSDGKTYCPCKKCANGRRYDPSTVKDHVRDFGFLQSYQRWVHHGEDYSNFSATDPFWYSNTSTSATNFEMLDAIDDVVAEQNTNEECRTNVDPEIDVLMAEVNTELYPGCSWMSSLNFLAKLMHIKVMNK